MQEITFTLQTITPLFLAGADQASAELRAPSFRGPMRYWQRALIGGLVGTNAKGIQTVSEEESAIFGATDTGSVVQVRIPKQQVTAKRELPEFERESRGRPMNGRDYLLWSMERSGGTIQGRPQPRKYLSPGISFQLILSAREGNEAIFQKGMAAFWLLTHLGGIGARSRRCAGSLQVINSTPIADSADPFSFDIPEDTSVLCSQLENGIRAARSLYKYAPASLKDVNFDVLSTSTCRIWLLLPGKDPWNTEDEAMRYIGSSLQDYRASRRLQDRKVFGLPLVGVDNRRLSSPLLLRITKLQNEQYLGIAVLFKTTVLGFKTSDYTLVEKWITGYFPNRLEVKL